MPSGPTVGQRRTSKTFIGCSLPLRETAGSAFSGNLPPRWLAVASDTRIWPPAAMPHRRALVFTVSPMTVYESDLELPT